MKHIIFLRIYLWLMAILFPIVLSLEITSDVRSTYIDYLDYIFWLTALIGLYSYCYAKTIISNNIFWKIYLPFIIVWDFYTLYVYTSGEAEFAQPKIIIAIVVAALIMLPEYIGLYLYAYKTKSPDNKINRDNLPGGENQLTE